ncbi:MAG: DNA polymerase IV [Eubacteriales bacterium]
MAGNKENRIILHCDLNSYFASVEMLESPQLQGMPVAVCGSVEARHGIVLARSEAAKKYGVRTAEAVWQAKKKCPHLIIIEPHYEKYVQYSRMVKDIYLRYTDRVESFGIDEAWLDITGNCNIFGKGEVLAYEIKEQVKREIGLTLSIGVSFCKIFSKMGSDLKKPDAVTCIPEDEFRDIVWDLPASSMLGVGRATGRKLSGYGIHTIGQIAVYPIEFFEQLFGVTGRIMWAYANGIDNSEVMRYTESPPMKSIGHGNTAISDLTDNSEVELMLFELSQDVSRRLREYKLQARRIQISVRDCDMGYREYQTTLPCPTQSYTDISQAAYQLFTSNYKWYKNIRALTVRAINLEPDTVPYQVDIFTDFKQRERINSLERAVEGVRARYGRNSIDAAALLHHAKIPAESSFDYNSASI